MKYFNTIVFFLTFILFCSGNIKNSRPKHIFTPSMFSVLPLKGKAEIAIYQGKVKRYNQMRKAELVLISVWEPFDPKSRVKNDHSNYYVLKQNQILTYQTGVYPYRQMNSLFWDPNTFQLLKITMTSQEWCGQTWKEILTHPDSIQFHFHSYWENEADGTIQYSYPKHLYFFYDELPLILRLMQKDLSRVSISIFPLLMSSRVHQASWDIDAKIEKPKFHPAKIKQERTTISFKGKKKSVIMFSVEFQKYQDRYYFDWDHPKKILLRWERNDGGFFELAHLSYEKYWELNHIGDHLSKNVYRDY